jgi:hypothetical protein
MSSAWMQAVGVGDDESIGIRQLSLLKQSLKTALSKRDWPLVCRLDRLSGQVVNKLRPKDRATAAEVVRELVEIKILYQQSIALIEKELTDLSNQAY